ncbi:glycosyltransferase family 2 protein [Saccharospirillum sp.]|uniref:glycosyltransferase family 2 protein n=1 Tax=Saccharospirillum sp. TaxID=2033801 RepID=UPI0034A05F24
MIEQNDNKVIGVSQQPKVSVVMPTHNRAKELPRSIRSVLSQSFSDFELIIIDDASTDNTEEVVVSFKDSRIIFKKLEANVGGAEARNVGIRLAKADIVAFQDSDDEWTCSKLENSLAQLESNQNLGAVFSKFIQIWDNGCRLMPVGKYSFNRNDVYKSLLWQNHVGTPTLVVKKKYLDEVGGFKPTMPRYQDWDLALKLAKVTELKFLDDYMLLSYVTKGSITQNKEAHLIALELLYKSHKSFINKDRALKAAWLHRIGDAMMNIGEKNGRRLLMEALKCEPVNIRYLTKFLFSIPGSGKMYQNLNKPFKS